MAWSWRGSKAGFTLFAEGVCCVPVHRFQGQIRPKFFTWNGAKDTQDPSAVHSAAAPEMGEPVTLPHPILTSVNPAWISGGQVVASLYTQVFAMHFPCVRCVHLYGGIQVKHCPCIVAECCSLEIQKWPCYPQGSDCPSEGMKMKRIWSASMYLGYWLSLGAPWHFSMTCSLCSFITIWAAAQEWALWKWLFYDTVRFRLLW